MSVRRGLGLGVGGTNKGLASQHTGDPKARGPAAHRKNLVSQQGLAWWGLKWRSGNRPSRLARLHKPSRAPWPSLSVLCFVPVLLHAVVPLPCSLQGRLFSDLSALLVSSLPSLVALSGAFSPLLFAALCLAPCSRLTGPRLVYPWPEGCAHSPVPIACVIRTDPSTAALRICHAVSQHSELGEAKFPASRHSANG